MTEPNLVSVNSALGAAAAVHSQTPSSIVDR